MPFDFAIPEFLDWVIQTWSPVGAQAHRAAYSRSHFSRVFQREVGESPKALRRRLQLEAGAHLLARTSLQVGEIAVEVGYQTPEAFAKALRCAFGACPRRFRASRRDSTWLPSRTGIHFHPSGLIVRRQGVHEMNLTQTLFRHHFDEVSRLLGELERLAPESLDTPIVHFGNEIPWDPHDKTLRGTLWSIVQTHEIWMATFRGEPLQAEPTPVSLAAIREVHERTAPRFLEFVEECERDGLWASEFVDANCEEPVRFVFGPVLAHILTFGIQRRGLILAGLRELGVKDIEYGDPINWQRGRIGEPMYVPDCA